MPKLTVWMVRTSFIYLGTGFLFGALILFYKGLPLFDWTWKLLNPHLTLMIFGWTMQFIMGVAFFILPRFADYKTRYGAEHLGWKSFYLFNAGVITSALGGWFSHRLVTVVGITLLLVGVLLYIKMMWSRVKPMVFQPPQARRTTP